MRQGKQNTLESVRGAREKESEEKETEIHPNKEKPLETLTAGDKRRDRRNEQGQWERGCSRERIRYTQEEEDGGWSSGSGDGNRSESTCRPGEPRD